MINNDRIVAVTATDLITLYGLILNVGGKDATALEATNPAEFEVTESGNTYLANEPVATLDFASDVSTATVYFVPAYNYSGFTADGNAIEASGDVDADGSTLYMAALASNAVTITKVGF